jgi:ribosomal protein L30
MASKAQAQKATEDKAIKVTLVKGLGLRRIGHSVVVADTPSNRGMVNAASHMLKVEPALGKV